ncbi:MAG: glycosyltransferase 87 family protein [Chloroflexaceae bacterium]
MSFRDRALQREHRTNVRANTMLPRRQPYHFGPADQHDETLDLLPTDCFSDGQEHTSSPLDRTNQAGTRPPLPDGAPTWRWLVTLALAGLSGGFYVMLLIGLLADPQLHGIDFLSFYTAGRLANTVPLNALYDLDRQRAIQHTLFSSTYFANGLLPFNHPPFLAPLLGLCVDSDYRASYLRWMGMMSVVATIAALILTRVYVEESATADATPDRLRCARQPASGEALLVAVGLLIFYPTFISLLKGQDTALILLGVSGWMAALRADRSLLAGLALGLTVIKPHLTLALGVPMLIARPRTAPGLLLSAGGLGVLSALLVGAEGIRDYLAIIAVSNAGEGFGLNQHAMYNLTGALLRAAPSLDPTARNLIKWGAFLLGIAAITWLWRRHSGRIETTSIGVAIVLTVLVAPHLHAHDLSLLALPVVALAVSGRSSRGPLAAWTPVLPAVLSVALLSAMLLSEPWSYRGVYLIMGLLLVGLISLEGGRKAQPRSPVFHP